jgi:hypothetical protein
MLAAILLLMSNMGADTDGDISNGCGADTSTGGDVRRGDDSSGCSMTDTDDSCAAELSFIARFTASCARRPML